MLNDLVSIIIPARDEENYIGEFSLHSVQKQIYKNLETIVVCNACRDATADIVRSFSDKIKNLKVLETEKAGVGHARNLGAKNSHGGIFVFLDADTAMSHNTVEEIVKAERKYDDIIGICKAYPKEKNLKSSTLTAIKNVIGRPFIISNGLIFCNKDLYCRIGGFNENMKRHEDGRFIRNGFKEIAISGKGGYVYLKNAYVIISMRRFEKLGYLRAMFEWLRPAKDYPVVR